MTQPTSGRGGYQRPRNPAPASGPGKLARRTDRQPVRALADAAYGEQATFRADQQGAPMAKAQTSPAPAAPSADLSQVVPFGAPTQNGNEPVTAGAAFGPGPGPEALGMGNPAMGYVRELLPMLSLAAGMPMSSPELRQFVRRLRAMN